MDKKPVNRLGIIAAISVPLLFAAMLFVYRSNTAEQERELEKMNSRISEMESRVGALDDELEKKQLMIGSISESVDLSLILSEKMRFLDLSEVKPPVESAASVENSGYIVKRELIDNNIDKMAKIQDYGTDIAIEYISPEKDKSVCCAVMLEVKRISDEICVGTHGDKDKLDSIAVWCAENISYDRDAARSGVTPEVISLERTLALKRTTCAGYSNLFSALCEAQGFYCINLRGGTYESEEDYPSDMFFEKAPTNHEWNAVLCDGSWLYYDTTWTSNNYYEYGVYNKTDVLSKENFGMGFAAMSHERRIDTLDHRGFFEAALNYSY